MSAPQCVFILRTQSAESSGRKLYCHGVAVDVLVQFGGTHASDAFEGEDVAYVCPECIAAAIVQLGNEIL